jgi:hypothetical protein
VRGRVGGVVLGLLLAATLTGAATFDRSSWPGFVGDEATYLMQAESLAFDFDLTYTRADYERFQDHWGRPPEGLILQSTDGGATLTYGKPFFYAAAIAPWVRLSPSRGPFVANALLLALAAVATALALARTLGPTTPWWVAGWLFASVAFGYVFWAHSDLALLVFSALALALAFGGAPAPLQPGALPEMWYGAPGDHRWRFRLRWAAAAALLAPLALARPFYASLLLPVALAVPRERRREGWMALVAGGAAALVVAAGLTALAHGTWTSYGGERMGFYSYTGFPEVDFPAADWPTRLAQRPGPGSWVARDRLLFPVDPRLLAYDGLYFLIGRHVGVLPYFLPLVLGLLAFRRGGGRGALLVAVALSVAGFFYVRPFNFYGGGGALANRYFLPLYPAFWFLPGRPARAAWAFAAAALAAPFLAPLWSAPRAFPLTDEGGLRYVSTAARHLPYETTLDHLKPSGRDDFVHQGLWVKPLTPAVRGRSGGQTLEMRLAEPAELLVGSPRPLSSLVLVFAPQGAPTRVEIDGGDPGPSAFAADGSSLFTVELGRPTARHRMWWTADDYYLYRLTLRAVGDDGDRASFRLEPDPP